MHFASMTEAVNGHCSNNYNKMPPRSHRDLQLGQGNLPLTDFLKEP